MIPDIPMLIFSFLVVLFAGFVRGYSGFGFSIIVVTSLSLIYPPAEVVPVLLLLEIAASIWLIPSIWRDIHWQSLEWLFLGVIMATPFGVYLLATIPQRPMRAAIAIIVLILSGLLFKGFKLKKIPGKPMTTITGIVSGVLNGAAAIGGPPVVLFYFSSPAGTAVSRASLIAFFLGTDILASGICMAGGLITYKIITFFAMLLIPMILGLILGSRSFIHTDPEVFRKRIQLLLMVIALVILGKTAFE